MLASKAKWYFEEKQENLSEKQEDSLDVSSTVMKLLQQRGITTSEEVQQFISPNITNMHDPKNLSMIDKAAERIHQAILNKEKILIYGDYDADGVSSTALLLKTFQEMNAICDFYIPNRFTEGYGLNEQAIREAHNNGYHLIITVDTGIASIAEAIVAKDLGIDLIITDHHEIQEQLPDAYAIINPKCSPDYQFHDLAGVGVAFKLAQHLLGYFPKHLLDFVAIGTIADLVPLVDENRIFAYYGLQQLTTTKNIGLKALIKVCNIDGQVTEEDVGFQIGPRINAVGRLQDASLAVELLISENHEEAEELALMIQSINEERQQIVTKIVLEAEQLVKEHEMDNVIIVAKEGWNEGVLGIVASRLVRKYDRPAIVLTIKPEGEVKGSARSIPAFNMFENCMKIRELFTQFGGHSQAAGMTFPVNNLADIRLQLNEQISEQLSEEDFKQVINVSDTVDVSVINEQLITEINQLAPFGTANPKPVFCLEAVPSEIRQIGSLKNHLKLQFKEADTMVEGIGFSIGDLYPFISPNAQLKVVGELGINEWNGVKKPQIIIRDLKIDEWQLFDHRGKRDTDLSRYMARNKRNLVIGELNLDHLEDAHYSFSQITYQSDITSLNEVDALFIFDLPPNLNILKDIIKRTKPDQIHLVFQIENSKYLQPFPTREDFKFFYGFVHQHEKVNLKEAIPYLIRINNWTKEFIIFMAKVFLELEFVKIENNIIEIQVNPNKKDIKSSQLYQKLLNEIEIEKVLYYSNHGKLKEWFSKLMLSDDAVREEVVYGL